MAEKLEKYRDKSPVIFIPIQLSYSCSVEGVAFGSSIRVTRSWSILNGQHPRLRTCSWYKLLHRQGVESCGAGTS